MSQRILKNYTQKDLILHDLGDLIVPANGAVDLGGDEQQLISLATSNSLLDAISEGIEKYQISDGIKNLLKSEAIDLIRKIQRPTEVDSLGRWVVRADSRRNDWDVVFQGAGDNMTTGALGGGTCFCWDFIDPSDFRNIEAPLGFKRQRIDFTFSSYVYVKEGSFYFYDMPKGSYIDMYLVAPSGSYFYKKTIDKELNIVNIPTLAGAIPVPFIHWVIKYRMEGSCPMGDELNTESATETPAPPGVIFRAEITVPEVSGYEKAHGHWALEMYRLAYDKNDDPNQA